MLGWNAVPGRQTGRARRENRIRLDDAQVLLMFKRHLAGGRWLPDGWPRGVGQFLARPGRSSATQLPRQLSRILTSPEHRLHSGHERTSGQELGCA
jgi:hypothetical protein